MIKGLHIDMCRHFIEFDTIMKTIELMAKLNFNTLHLHLSDDQSIAFESEKYPQIKFDKMLTIKEQNEIAALCNKYMIDIIPEIDIPGHTQALRHIFGGEPLEKRLGVITTGYINLETYMPIIFDLFDELIWRFNTDRIHIGCDEAKQFTKFPELIKTVESWCRIHCSKFIVWDDVVSKLTDIPSNLIVQRWRHYTSGKIVSQNIPYILSEGYYLDHCEDPLYLYNKNPNPYGANLLGYIACTWTELIDNNNFHSSIVPSVYLLSKKWDDVENGLNRNDRDIPKVLYDMCQLYGYPIVEPRVDCVVQSHAESGMNTTWKRRRWASFFNKNNDPRCLNSVDVTMELNREHDCYPVFSKFLIDLLYHLYLVWIEKQEIKDDYFRTEVDKIIKENFDKNYNIDWLFDNKSTNVKDKINSLVTLMKTKEDPYSNNGLIPVLRYISRNI